MSGLCESAKGVWSGDVDLNDGSLQQLYRDHQTRLEFINAIGVKGRAGISTIKSDLEEMLQYISQDLQLSIESNMKCNITCVHVLTDCIFIRAQ